MDAGGPGPLWGVQGLGYRLGASPPQGHMASPDPSLSGERVRASKGLTYGARLLRPLPRIYG
jgi:hypothetical protein